MKLWRWILLLVIVAALAAFGWHWVAEDPGYVLVQLRGWQAETTVIAAVVILLLAKHLNAETPALPAEHTDLQGVVNKLMAKNPEHRYESADS